MRTLRLAVPLAVLLAVGPAAPAGDLLPADRPVEEAVDHFIDARLRDEGITPVAVADDATLLRRLTLDLVGRIPTAGELDAYLADTDPAKRTALADRLMAAPGFVRHQTAEFDALLMAGTKGSLRNYLAEAFAENRPWDRMFRELLLPDESDPKRKGTSEFLRQRAKDLDKLTTEVSVLFFGVNVSCAQCHDHPLVPDWKQDHFYGMKSFFARTVDAGGTLGETEFGVVRFQTSKGLSRDARMMFLTGATADAANLHEPTREEQKKDKERLDALKQKKPVPPPAFSARAALVELALRPDQRDFFAKAIVNRVWHRLFGRGLVAPVDQMHAENPPSHPELLDWLARDVAEHGYDLRRLTRGLVLSRAYARGSRWDGPGDAPRPELFAVARVRPLTPLQLAASLRIATADPATLTGLPPVVFEKRVEDLVSAARGFASAFEQPGDDFQIGVSESLFLSNGERFQKEILSDAKDRLIGRLLAAQNRDEIIDLAVRATLSRPPTPEERHLLGEYLARREDRKTEACRQMTWALLAGSEFRFNH